MTKQLRCLPAAAGCLPFLACLLLASVGCSDREPDHEAVPPGLPSPGDDHARPFLTEEREWAGLRTRDLDGFGSKLEDAVRINDFIYQTRGTVNINLVVTPAGNVIIDTGLSRGIGRYKAMLDRVSDAAVTHIVLSHAHADHFGGTSEWRHDDTEVIVHREFLHNQEYLKDLMPYLMPRNRIFYPNDVPEIPAFGRKLLKHLMPIVEPTIVVSDEPLPFEVGGIRFVVIPTPGAEGSDSISVWLPDHKILFAGDLFGHAFGMWPNFTTIRGERPRYPRPYIDSLNRVLALEPEMIIPSHFYPVRGKEVIREVVTRTREAVQYVDDAVIEGMNDGKDVHTLMREIELPEEHALPEIHGKVSWGVRSIWEAYTGWFYLDSTTELYSKPASSVHSDLVSLAGGIQPLIDMSRSRLDGGEPVEALHLLDVVSTIEPTHPEALRVRLDALTFLLEQSGDVNHHEVFWLEHRIAEMQEQLGER